MGLVPYLRRAEKAAGVERLPPESFNILRRKFVSDNEHLPDVDVAQAAVWRSTNTMRRSDRQADEAGVLEVLMEPQQLRGISA